MRIISFILVFLFIPILDAKIVELDRCVDGDTARFVTDKGIEVVRFLAIDTPETNHPQRGVERYGAEASEFTCQKLKNAKVIRIEMDNNSDEYDRYQRLLSWVFVDNYLLQELIIENGLGRVAYLYGDYEYTDVLKIKEEYAKAMEIGIWSPKNDYESFKVTSITLLIMGAINLIYFNYQKSRKSYINKIYNIDGKLLKSLLVIIYAVTIVFVVYDFGIFLDKLVGYMKKMNPK